MRKLLSISVIAALVVLSACGDKPNHIFNVENDSPNGPRVCMTYHDAVYQDRSGYFCRDKPTGVPESLKPQPSTK